MFFAPCAVCCFLKHLTSSLLCARLFLLDAHVGKKLFWSVQGLSSFFLADISACSRENQHVGSRCQRTDRV